MAITPLGTRKLAISVGLTSMSVSAEITGQ